jgi:hypothetical protein
LSKPREPRRRSAGRVWSGAALASVEFRVRVGFLLIAMVLSLFAARLVQLQAIDPGAYAEMAAAEGSVQVTLPATRGEILDRDGVARARSLDGRMIVADPSLTRENAADMARLFAQRLDLDYFQTLERLRRSDSRFQYIARQVPASLAEDVVADLRAEGFRGLYTQHDPLRSYPGGDVAANLVGFLGTPENDGTSRALAGLEDAFDRHLAGTDGEARYQMGAGNQIPLGDNTVTPAVDGHDLQTTLDADLQWYAQRVLQQTIKQAGAVSGHAVIMDTRTAGLLAVADYPTYDASKALNFPESRYKAASLTDPYEPGSVQKVLTVAALVDAGVERDGWSVGGFAKGAGMCAPNMATMLSVITTDAAVDWCTSSMICGRPRPSHATIPGSATRRAPGSAARAVDCGACRGRPSTRARCTADRYRSRSPSPLPRLACDRMRGPQRRCLPSHSPAPSDHPAAPAWPGQGREGRRLVRDRPPVRRCREFPLPREGKAHNSSARADQFRER